MKGSLRDPSRASINCASRCPPRVATTIAWVSPRVNTVLPCAFGKLETATWMGRTWLGVRPSMRDCVVTTALRTTSLSRRPNKLLTSLTLGPSSALNVSTQRSEEHTSELQSRFDLVCRLLLEKKNQH